MAGVRGEVFDDPGYGYTMWAEDREVIESAILNAFLLIYAIQTEAQTYNKKNYEKYKSIGIYIIKSINGTKSDNLFSFSPRLKKEIEDYGYENFLSYYHNKFGTITASDPPIILSVRL